MAEEDPSYNEALVTMRQSRYTMNRFRNVRGFFKGKIDGVLEESSGPGMQKGKGKGKIKGKGKGRGRPDVRCKNCGRTDHESADCPQMQVDGGSSSSSTAPRSLWTPRSNGKGKGGGRKGKRQLGMWVTTVTVGLPGIHHLPAQLRESESLSFPVEVTFDDALISVQHQSYTLIDSGCTAAIAGREWLENIAEKLKHYHLQPIREDTYQSFTGLGGAKRESHRKWILPIGISCKHTTQAYYEIPGSMIGLTSREDLERWGCNLNLRSHEIHAEFETFNIYGKSLLRLPYGHAVLDIMDYDEKYVLDDPIFKPFVTGKKGSSALLAFV